MSYHFLSLEALSANEINDLLTRAQFYSHNFKQNHQNILKDKIIANVFYEPSTRTRCSFEIAAKKLGAHVINFSPENSSVKKGETVYDTLKSLESLGVDAIVLRHSDDHIFSELQNKFSIPLINAGAGKFEHPSQGLLDLLTIKDEFKTLDGLKICVVGDIKHSRVAGSLFVLAKKFNMIVKVDGPDELLPKNLPSHIGKTKINDALNDLNVLMLLRMQLERHDSTEIIKQNYLIEFGLNKERIKRIPHNAIIMHPGPFNRGIEIDSDLVEHHQSRIFKQMNNGVFARMSILEHFILKRKT